MRPLLAAVSLLVLSVPALAELQPKADLAVDAYLAPRVAPGDSWYGNISIRNNGPDPAQNIVVTVNAGRFDDRSSNCPHVEGNRCTIDILPVGTELPLNLLTDPDQPYGSIEQTVEIASATPDPNPHNNRVASTVDFTRAPRLRFWFIGTPTADPGGPAEYQTQITNESNVEATNVRFTIPLPDGWDFEGTTSEDLRCEQAGRELTCTLARIAAASTVRSRFVLRAPPALEGQELRSVRVNVTTDAGVFDDPVRGQLDVPYLATIVFHHLTVTTTAGEGPGSLREAIITANGVCKPGGAPCKVVFDVAGEGTHQTIRPASPLPVVTSFLTIDGATQTARHGDTNPLGPEIEINGSLLTSGHGFESSQGLTLRDVAVNGFPGDGVVFRGQGFGKIVERCYIGTDVTGRLAVPNGGRGIAVDIAGEYPNAYLFVRDSVISGNARSGIFLFSGNEATITGNRIGVSAGDRPEPLGNGASGIYAGPRASGVAIVKNVIAHNGEAGIGTAPHTGYVVIRGNSIYANGGLGIDYGLDLVTPGPTKDVGPLPPFPVLTSARYDAATGITHVEGNVPAYVSSGVAAVELFANDDDGDEGELFLGRVVLKAPAFTFDYAGDLRGRSITATHTEPNSYYPESLYLLTSELSVPLKVEGEAPAPIDPAAVVPRGADLWLRVAPMFRVLAETPMQVYLSVQNLGPAPAGDAVVLIESDRGRLTSPDRSCAESGTGLRCVLTGYLSLYVYVTAPADAETISISARIENAPSDPDLTNNADAITVPVSKEAGLQFEVDSPGAVDPGAAATYHVRVKHYTGYAAHDVAVHIPLPYGWSLVSSTDWRCTTAAEEVVCRTARIEGLSTESFTYTLRAPSEEHGVRAFSNQLRITASNGVLNGLTAYAVYEVYELLHVTTADDDGAGSLRDAITRANNDCAPYYGRNCKIVFDGVTSIQPARPLPAVTAQDILINGDGKVTIDGSRAGGNGLELAGNGDRSVRGVTIANFAGHGIVVRTPQLPVRYNLRSVLSDNVITGNGGRGIVVEAEAGRIATPIDIVANTITANGRAGIAVTSGQSMRISANRVAGNGASGIYLGNTAGILVEGNEVTGNTHAGIAVDRAAKWNSIRGNSTFANGGLGVDHGLDLVTFNDDAERVAELPRFPVITSAVWDAAAQVTRIEGIAEGARDASNIVELFANAEPDGTGYGEAQRSLGEVTLEPGAGEKRFTFSVAEDLRGTFVTATLSRRGNGFHLSWTSEIGQAVRVP